MKAPVAPIDLVVLRIAGVPEHFNLPWQLGLERRAFVRAGVEVRWRTVPEGTGAMCKLLRDGEVDLAMMVTEGAVRDIMQDGPYRIISDYVDSPLTWGVHVGAATSLHTPADLKNIPFAISRFNSGSHLAAMRYAKEHGWSPEEKDFVLVNDLKGAIERLQGPEPLTFIWEMATTSPAVDQGLLRKVDEHVSPGPCFVVVARNEALAEHADAMRRLLRVLHDQAEGLMQKKQAPEMVAQRYGMSIENARAWFSQVRWNTTGTVNTQALMAVGEQLHGIGAIERALVEEDLARIVTRVRS